MLNKLWRTIVIERRGELSLLLLCLFLFFWRLGSARLFDMDEGLYVSCARQMVASGDYISPRLNVRPHNRAAVTTVPFFEKPILTYWAAAGALKAFGPSEGSARIPVASATLIATILVVWAGARWIGRRAGLLAGLVYATAPMVVLDGRQMTTDALLTLWFLIAMIAQRKRWPFLFSTACALGVLTKGIIGVLLPLLVVAAVHFVAGISAGWHGRPFRWFVRPTSAGLVRFALCSALFLTIVVPWHIAIYNAGGIDAMGHTWVQEYIIRQHVGRFKGSDIHHNAPIITYFGYFLIGFFPWACFTPFAFRFARRTDALADTCAPRPMDTAAETRRFLLCWFWTIFIFFSLSAAKLPTYIVPAYPAAALMVGHWLDAGAKRRSRARDVQNKAGRVEITRYATGQNGRDEAILKLEARRFRKGLNLGAGAALCTATLLLAATLLVPAFTRGRPVMPEAVSMLSILAALITALGCFASWICFRRAAHGRIWTLAGIWLLAGTMTVLIAVVAGPGYRIINRWLLAPYQDLAVLARSDARNRFPVVFYDIGDRRPSMLYYARDYSPLERKETPLLPFLKDYLPAGGGPAAIVTLRRNYEKQLRPELDAAGWGVDRLEMRDSGLDTWLLLRIYPPKELPAAMKRESPAVRHAHGR